MTTPLDTFETALLANLREQVAQQPVARRRLTRPRLLLGAAAAAAAAVALVVVPGPGGDPAYSVQEGNSGTITVKVDRPEDAEGLEAELATHGVTADITYLPDRQECAPGRYTPVARRLSGMQVSIGADRLEVTLPPGVVRDGETFVMALSGAATPPETEPDGSHTMGGYGAWTDFDVAAGAVQPCRPVPGGRS